ncbi:MAG: hypothetical protein WBV84_04520 [Nitrososphaeraceae archaeon]
MEPAVASTKPSTKGVTFRLSKEKLEHLRNAADARTISPNTLFNQIIKSYLDWHSMAADAKLYYLPKSFLIRLLNELTNDDLNELAMETAKNDLVDVCLFLRGGFNIASISEIAQTWLRIAQMSHRIEVTGKLVFVFREYSSNFSVSYNTFIIFIVVYNSRSSVKGIVFQ